MGPRTIEVLRGVGDEIHATRADEFEGEGKESSRDSFTSTTRSDDEQRLAHAVETARTALVDQITASAFVRPWLDIAFSIDKQLYGDLS